MKDFSQQQPILQQQWGSVGVRESTREYYGTLESANMIYIL